MSDEVTTPNDLPAKAESVADMLAKTPTEPNGDCAYRMDGYYIQFDMTGIDIIDNILSAVACAEKAYHYTECWNDEAHPYSDKHSGASPVDWIQNAARDARDRIERALASPQCVPVEALSGDFIRRTNEDYAAWCKTQYTPDCLDERGFPSLFGLWAWQEQERRKMGIKAPASVADDVLCAVRKAMRQAYHLGQVYWQQADSEYASQNKKADVTASTFGVLVEETVMLLTTPDTQP